MSNDSKTKEKKIETEDNKNDLEPVSEVPWTALIICGVILLLMIGCIITIVCLK